MRDVGLKVVDRVTGSGGAHDEISQQCRRHLSPTTLDMAKLVSQLLDASHRNGRAQLMSD